MMQCPQCGTSNRLGALFCRSCGVKLDVDSVTKDTFEQVTGVVPKDRTDAKKRVRKLISNLISLVVLALLVLGVYLAVQIPQVEEPKTTSKLATEFESTQLKLGKAIAQKREVTVTITEGAINSYLAERLGATENKGKTFQLLDTWILLGDDNALDWVIDTKLFGRRLRFRYKGKLVVDDDGVVFKPKGFFSARLGALPYPTPLLKRTVSKLWKSIRDEETNEAILNAVSDVKIDGNTITVTVTP
jgi:hypothetical protein